MNKSTRTKKGRAAHAAPAPPAPALSAEAQELRALLRRVPDGFQATLNSLAARPAPDRERVLTELARGLGKEFLPLVRAAAVGEGEDLACSAVKVLPLFGTRAAADALVEAYRKSPEGERAAAAMKGATALRARGIHVALPEPDAAPVEALRLTLRETSVSVPDGVGSRSVAARLQDQYGVWHAVLVLWNDQAGVKDGFLRPMSRHEWSERMQRMDDRGTCHAACPPDFARWQVTQARRLNEETGLPLGDHLQDWDKYVGGGPVDYAPPDPLEPVRAANDGDRQGWLAEGGLLLKQPDIARWFLEAADCVPFSRRWSDLQLRLRYRGENDELQTELRELLHSTLETLVGDGQKKLYLGRLLDAARVYSWRGQDLVARRAAAVALELSSAGPLQDNPFFVELARRSLRATEALLLRGDDLERLRYKPLRRYQS